MNKKIQCPYCFEKFTIEVFLEDGYEQDLIYDCEICCHPLEIKMSVNTETNKIRLDVDKSTGF